MNKFRKRQLTIPKCIRKSRNPDVGVVNCRIIIICIGIWAYNNRLKHRFIHYNNPFFMPHRENLWKLKPQGIFCGGLPPHLIGLGLLLPVPTWVLKLVYISLTPIPLKGTPVWSRKRGIIQAHSPEFKFDRHLKHLMSSLLVYWYYR